MKTRSINTYLFSTILTLSLSSFLASYILLDEILTSSIKIGLNQKTGEVISNYQLDLKLLRKLDPINESDYKAKFYNAQEALLVYKEPGKITSIIKDSYLTYFLIIFISILFVSIGAALLLSKKVSNTYHLLMQSNIANFNRLQELEYFDNWQKIAANLAHEIKNPLTPIEMMVSNLKRSYERYSEEDFLNKLEVTQRVVKEEVGRLKDMVKHFSEFSTLPEPNPKNIVLVDYIKELFEGFKISWVQLKVNIDVAHEMECVEVSIDPLLIKQCLLNLVQNAFDANPENKKLEFSIKISKSSKKVLELVISNIGNKLTSIERQKLFLIGYSTKSRQSNQGLGLSIVKKIVLDHHGDIESIEYHHGVAFKITLPINDV